MCLGSKEEAAENLCIRARGQTNMGDVVSVCYRPPYQEEDVDL